MTGGRRRSRTPGPTGCRATVATAAALSFSAIQGLDKLGGFWYAETMRSKYRRRASMLVYLEQDLLDQLDAYLSRRGRSAFVVAAVLEALANTGKPPCCGICGASCPDCESRAAAVRWAEEHGGPLKASADRQVVPPVLAEKLGLTRSSYGDPDTSESWPPRSYRATSFKPAHDKG